MTKNAVCSTVTFFIHKNWSKIDLYMRDVRKLIILDSYTVTPKLVWIANVGLNTVLYE